jgi:hypothetical protein
MPFIPGGLCSSAFPHRMFGTSRKRTSTLPSGTIVSDLRLLRPTDSLKEARQAGRTPVASAATARFRRIGVPGELGPPGEARQGDRRALPVRPDFREASPVASARRARLRPHGEPGCVRTASPVASAPGGLHGARRLPALTQPGSPPDCVGTPGPAGRSFCSCNVEPGCYPAAPPREITNERSCTLCCFAARVPAPRGLRDSRQPGPAGPAGRDEPFRRSET